jgi:ribosomal protein S24E
MKVEIASRTKNPLLQREEICFSVEGAEKTPSRKELREKVAAHLGAKTELVSIEKISQEFGAHSINGTARLYASEDAFKKTELPYMVARNLGQKLKKEKKTAAAKAEEKPAEAKKPAAKPAGEKAAEKKPAEENPAEKK